MPYLYTLRAGAWKSGAHRTIKRAEALSLINRTLDRLRKNGERDAACYLDGEVVLLSAQGRVRRGYGTQQIFVDGDSPKEKWLIDVEEKG